MCHEILLRGEEVVDLRHRPGVDLVLGNWDRARKFEMLLVFLLFLIIRVRFRFPVLIEEVRFSVHRLRCIYDHHDRAFRRASILMHEFGE